jgi:hypothetical protein
VAGYKFFYLFFCLIAVPFASAEKKTVQEHLSVEAGRIISAVNSTVAEDTEWRFMLFRVNFGAGDSTGHSYYRQRIADDYGKLLTGLFENYLQDQSKNHSSQKEGGLFGAAIVFWDVEQARKNLISGGPELSDLHFFYRLYNKRNAEDMRELNLTSINSLEQELRAGCLQKWLKNKKDEGWPEKWQKWQYIIPQTPFAAKSNGGVVRKGSDYFLALSGAGKSIIEYFHEIYNFDLQVTVKTEPVERWPVKFYGDIWRIDFRNHQQYTFTGNEKLPLYFRLRQPPEISQPRNLYVALLRKTASQYISVPSHSYSCSSGNAGKSASSERVVHNMNGWCLDIKTAQPAENLDILLVVSMNEPDFLKELPDKPDRKAIDMYENIRKHLENPFLHVTTDFITKSERSSDVSLEYERLFFLKETQLQGIGLLTMPLNFRKKH